MVFFFFFAKTCVFVSFDLCHVFLFPQEVSPSEQLQTQLRNTDLGNIADKVFV